ncbi:MGMT family protein [Nocardioides marinus]|uniref:Alkylated DNA nucleotide flippase Atl1 n=1 Tax=Nocardioides marinus TaxID=374514 RepID=A0A7Z0C2I5_9ACTN|nr:MGMT family protein [Nocardioides marinus]NYI10058.1 alkylated DNA nucleotide flippase Atl1 [Nocardioides marinus]
MDSHTAHGREETAPTTAGQTDMRLSVTLGDTPQDQHAQVAAALRACSEPFDARRALTEFQAAVVHCVRGLKPGEVVTYGWVAEQVRSPGGAIAVGQALMPFSPFDGVPWWRVVLAGGALTNFKHLGDPGLPLVRSLLMAEGVGFTDDGRVAQYAEGSPVASGGGVRSSRKKREPQPCYDPHETVQLSCYKCR